MNGNLHQRARLLARTFLGNLGGFLPKKTKIQLARRSSKFGLLLLNDGDFILDDYLDTYRFKINAKHETERALVSGKYEPEVLSTIRAHVRPGDVCLDIGANVGAIAFAMAKQVGSMGRVYCLEPGQTFLNRLRENVTMNPGLPTILSIHELGVSNRPGELTWKEDKEFPGNGYCFGKSGTAVSVTTLDLFCIENQLSKVHFIKIDIEGMEWEALSGGIQTLRRHRPRVLFETRLEFEKIRKQPVLQMIETLLNELGYQLFRVDPNGAISRTTYPHFSHNTLALPDSAK